MNRITPQDIQKGVETVSASPESTWYKVIETLDNGDELCLAIGMGEGFDEDTVCAKLGILAANSAMSDYVWDFQMPWNLGEGGNDVWDTEVSNPGESDAEWFNKTAQEMIRGLESGEIGTSLLGSACGKKKGKKRPVKSSRRPIKNNFVEKHGIYHNDTWKLEVVELEGNTAILKPVKSDDYFVVKNPEIDEQGDLVWTSDSLPMTDYDTALKEFNYHKDLNNASPTFNSRKPIQSMYVTQDISGNDLYTCLWSGGKDQFDSMIEDGADPDDILNACEELLFREEGNPPTMTELNDLIWFEPDTIREYIGLSNPIESGCHGKSKKKGKKKAVKSAAQISEIHNATSDCFVRITRSDVPEVGKVNDTIPLYEFKDNCRSYAETTNGSYYVTMDDTYEGEYFVEFSTGDTSFAPEDQRDDPYYNESLGTLQFEIIWNPGQELCNYLND